MQAEFRAAASRHWHAAVGALRSRLYGIRNSAWAGVTYPSGLRSLAGPPRPGPLTVKVRAGLLGATAILILAFVGAGAMAEGAASGTQLRTHQALALQQVAARYRQARALCQREPKSARNACIAQAHAEEDRGRTMATLGPPNSLTALRQRTDAGIDAGDHDSIIVEPACSVVVRGQASTCEIQLRPTPESAIAAAGARGA